MEDKLDLSNFMNRLKILIKPPEKLD